MVGGPEGAIGRVLTILSAGAKLAEISPYAQHVMEDVAELPQRSCKLWARRLWRDKSGRGRRDNQDEKKQPSEGMIVAGGVLPHVAMLAFA
jgi:hypothetical protein